MASEAITPNRSAVGVMGRRPGPRAELKPATGVGDGPANLPHHWRGGGQIKNDGDIEVSKIFITPKVRDLEDGELTDAESLVDSTPEEGELSKSLIVEWIVVTRSNETYTLSDYSGKPSMSLTTSPYPC